MPPEAFTLEEYKAHLALRRSMDREVDCPDPDCEEGFVSSGLCGGHICDWEGHWPEYDSTIQR